MAKGKPEQTGGKRVGSGLYGCVFDPPLVCKQTNPTGQRHVVGKVTGPEEAKVEYSISQTLSTVPNASEYFVLIEEVCTPKPRTQQTEPDLSKCDVAKGKGYDSLVQLIMPFAGRTLASIPKQARNIDYLAFGQHLLEAGTLLLVKGIVHYDIHVQNIVLKDTKTPKLLDFGVSFRPGQVNILNYRHVLREFNPAITQEPPEISVVNGRESKLSESVVLATISQKKDILNTLAVFTGTSVQDQMQRLRRFLASSWSYQDQSYIGFFKLYWSKIDAWAIGTILTSVFQELLLDPEFENSLKIQERYSMILKILGGLCDTDPGFRLDCAEALSLWAPQSEVLKQTDVQAWLSQQKKTRQELLAKTSTSR